MNFKFLKFFFVFLLIGLVFLTFHLKPIYALGHASDMLSLSWPNATSNHTIKFLTTKTIPASGKIIITPESGFFTIPIGFNYSDIDLSIATSSNGVFVDRQISVIPSALTDGVVTIFSTTSTGNINITLNSSSGISAGSYVKIKLGKNAEFGATGTKQIINPVNVGPYSVSVYTYDQNNSYLERAIMKVAIINPVVMGTKIVKSRLGGVPFGMLSYGTTQTIMSLFTNFPATCRYSTASGTLYADMTNTFTFTGNTYHSIMLSGLAGGNYEYYVRCLDANGVSDDETNCTYNASSTPFTDASGTPVLSGSCIDYRIIFTVASEEGTGGNNGAGGGGDSNGTPGGGGGGAGSGHGGGSGSGTGAGSGELLPFPPPPGPPTAILQGYSYPKSSVTLLRDGVKEKTIIANDNAGFNFDIYDLPQGVYTFGVWAEDKSKRKSPTQSFTFYIKEGTQNQIYDIFIPPTIELNKTNFNPGEVIDVVGESAPGGTVEIWLYPKKDKLSDSEIIKKNATTSASGAWSIFLNTKNLDKGLYRVKAKAKLSTMGESDFSQIIECGLGETVKTGSCPGADLNHDGKVNITDFSILLYWWGTDNICADQNSDKTVNLIDFSIMMFYWTG